jgi:hypothetical protein
MINKGDKVICTSFVKGLTIGKAYTILEIGYLPNKHELGLAIQVINDCAWKSIGSIKNFITIAEWREQQINSILDD